MRLGIVEASEWIGRWNAKAPLITERMKSAAKAKE